MFFDNFMSRCEDIGAAPSKVLTDLGIGKAGLKRWREGVEPSNVIKKKIADYFGITVKELMSGEVTEKNKPVTDIGNELTSEQKHFLDLIKQLPSELLPVVSAQIEGLIRKQ